MERRGIQERWLMFKDQLLQAQERSISMFRKLKKDVRRQSCICKKFLTELRHEKPVYKKWKQG